MVYAPSNGDPSKKPRGLFITGTGTGVGKTMVARGLIRALVNRGFRIAAVKPIESGARLEGSCLVPEDAVALRRAAKETVPLERICHQWFAAPLSPHLAAAQAQRSIDGSALLAFLREREADLVVAEGAGGLLVPLNRTELYADVMARSGYPLIIVAPNALGSINTTLLTIEAARARNIEVLGVILNRTPTAAFGNADAIRNHSNVPILGELPDGSDDDDDLATLVETHLCINDLCAHLFGRQSKPYSLPK